MNKAIILDIDGVIIGSQKGINSPHPHPEIMAKLKEVRAAGIPISLCTAKPAFAMEYEITNANLDNPHIADGGGLLVDNKGKVYEQFTLDRELAKRIIKTLLEKDTYTELYTATDYYIQESQKSKITDDHTFVLGREPIIVDSLSEAANHLKITKIMQVVADENHKPHGDETFAPFDKEATMAWAIHPPILPLQFGVITASGISKAKATASIANILGVPLENMLAVGDSTADWKFMQLCGYTAAMGNATDELKELVATKPPGHYMVGDHVDNNGLVAILDWYLQL